MVFCTLSFFLRLIWQHENDAVKQNESKTSAKAASERIDFRQNGEL
jgi:hypothetical protein